MPESERWLVKSTGKKQYTQALCIVNGWSMTDAYTTVLGKYNQEIEALYTRLQSEDDDGVETRALYTRNIYRETFEVAVFSATQVELSALAKSLSTAIFNNVHSLTESMNAYGSFLPVVQRTISAYDSATRVESGSNVAVVGPLIGQLQVHGCVQVLMN